MCTFKANDNKKYLPFFFCLRKFYNKLYGMTILAHYFLIDKKVNLKLCKENIIINQLAATQLFDFQKNNEQGKYW